MISQNNEQKVNKFLKKIFTKNLTKKVAEDIINVMEFYRYDP